MHCLRERERERETSGLYTRNFVSADVTVMVTLFCSTADNWKVEKY